MNHGNHINAQQRIGAIAGAACGMATSGLETRTRDQLSRALGVPEAIKRLAECNEELSSTIGALHARIAPVLLPLGDTGPGEPLPPTPVRSPVAHEIHAEADRVWGFTCALRELMARLDA